MPATDSQVTELLIRWSDGDSHALHDLIPLVYRDLRILARSQFRREKAEHTLQPTALINEVYLRLEKQHLLRWENRHQFFAFAAMLMRRLLVDHARAKRAKRRGGDVQVLHLEEVVGEPDGIWQTQIDLIALDQAFTKLETLDPRQLKIVEMRFFLGLSTKEIAEALDRSERTIKREWSSARLWLLRELGQK